LQSPIQKQADRPDIALLYKLILLIVVLAASYLVDLNSALVGTALPLISEQYNINISTSQWATFAYLLAMSGLFIVFGQIAESVGRIKLFTAGLAVFTLGSLACGLPGSAEQFILFLIIQGIGASAMSGVGVAVLFDAFSPKWRGTALGCVVAVSGVSGASGTILSSIIVEAFGWPATALLSAVPAALLLLCGGFICLKVPEARSNRPADWVGALLLTASFALAVVLGLSGSSSPQISPSSPQISLLSIGSLAMFVVLLAAFVVWELTRPDAPRGLRVLGDKKFLLSMASMMLLSVATGGIFTLILSCLLAYGYNPAEIGVVLILLPLSSIVPALAGGLLYDLLRWKYLTAAGLLIVAAGCLLLGLALQASDLSLTACALIAVGAGSGLFRGPNLVNALSALPPERSATASSVMAAAGSIASSFGLFLVGALMAVQANSTGYSGSVAAGSQSLWRSSLSIAVVIAILLCIVAAAFSVLRNTYRTG